MVRMERKGKNSASAILKRAQLLPLQYPPLSVTDADILCAAMKVYVSSDCLAVDYSHFFLLVTQLD